MQTATETPLPQPQAITTPGPDGKPITITVPKSVEEVRDLVEHRRELSNQLTDVTNRRDQLARELQTAPPGVARTGLEERVRVLDQRILQLESDLARTGQQLAAAPSEYTSAVDFENRPRSTSDEDFAGGWAGGTFSTLAVVFVVSWYRRRRRKKKGGPAQATAIAGDSAERLERIERGMEAIAIEIERVTEGQRFVTKVLTEAPEPVAARRLAERPTGQGT